MADTSVQRVSNIDLPNNIKVFQTYLVMLVNKKTASLERDYKV